MSPRIPVAGFALPRRQLAWLLLLGLGQAITLISLVLLLRVIIDALATPYGDVAQTLVWVAILAAVLIVNAMLRAVEFTVAERMGFEVVRVLRMTMYEHLGRMNPSHLQHRSRGAILLRFTGDLTMLRTWISRGIGRGIVSTVVLVSVLGVLAYFDVWISLALAATLLLGAAGSLMVGQQLRKRTRWVRRRRSLLTSNVDEQIASLTTVQVLGRGRGEYDRLAEQNDALTRSLGREAGIRGALRGVASATAWLAMVAVIAVGAIEISRGRASVAIVIAAATASRFAIGMVRDIGLAHDYWQRAQVSRRKIEEFLRSSAMPAPGPMTPALSVRRGRVEFRDTSVTGVLEGITAVVEPGTVVAIMGPTGSGKSSMLRLVARSLEPSSGLILVDDQELADCSLGSLRRQVSMVSQDIPLMRGTVRRNLTYRVPRADEGEVARLSLTWRLGEAFAATTGGLDGWVTEGGGNLSAGQRQRLSLARGTLGNPRILLLDEPTLGLDTEGREIFRRVLGSYRGTVLLVTHEPADAVLADEVWVVERGAIAERISGAEYRGRLTAVELRARSAPAVPR